MLRVGEHHPPDAARPAGEELALVDEVRGEEDHEQDLGRLARLEVERPDADPEARAVDLLPMPGSSGSSSATTPRNRNV